MKTLSFRNLSCPAIIAAVDKYLINVANVTSSRDRDIFGQITPGAKNMEEFLPIIGGWTTHLKKSWATRSSEAEAVERIESLLTTLEELLTPGEIEALERINNLAAESKEREKNQRAEA